MHSGFSARNEWQSLVDHYRSSGSTDLDQLERIIRLDAMLAISEGVEAIATWTEGIHDMYSSVHGFDETAEDLDDDQDELETFPLN